MQRRHATLPRTPRSTCAAVIALAAVMLLSVLALRPASAAADAGAAPVGAEKNDGNATVATKAGPTRTTMAPRPLRAVPLTLAVLAGAVTISGTARWARGRTLLGLQRHRIDDDGDDWRSLLRGAPPALA